MNRTALFSVTAALLSACNAAPFEPLGPALPGVDPDVGLVCPTCMRPERGACVAVAGCTMPCRERPEVIAVAEPFGRGRAIDVELAGEYAFVLTTIGLEIDQLGEASGDPTPVAFVPLTGALESLVLADRRAFVAAGETGVWIIDISDPRAPVEAGRIDLVDGTGRIHPASGVAARGDYLYAVGPAGLAVFEREEPIAFVELISARRVALDGDIAWVAAGENGIAAIDIRDPRAPVELSTLDQPGHAVAASLAVAGSRLYVAANYGGLQIIDISDPAHPEELGHHEESGFYATEVAVEGSRAFITAGYGAGIRVFDVADPRAPVQVAAADPPDFSAAIALRGTRIYVALGLAGLAVYEVGESLEEVGHFDRPGEALDLRVANGIAYIADSEAGLRIFDVRDPARPRELATFATNHPANAVELRGGLAFVVTKYQDVAFQTDGTIEVIDVSDPRAPRRIAEREIGLWAATAAFSDDKLLLGDIFRGVVVFDVNDPRAPRRIANLGMAGLADLASDGRWAFGAERFRGLAIADVADPNEPKTVARFATKGGAHGLDIEGSLLALADGTEGVHLFDISDPRAPKPLALLRVPVAALDVDLVGGRMVIFTGATTPWARSALMFVADVRDPANPLITGAVSTPGEARKLASGGAGGNIVFAADGESLLATIALACE